MVASWTHLRNGSVELRLLVTAVLLTLGTVTAPARAQSDDVETEELAARHHERGLELFETGDFEAAIEEFETAQTLLPSRANLWNLVQCQLQMGNTVEAMVQLELYVRSPELPPERLRQALVLREEIRRHQNDTPPEAAEESEEEHLESETPTLVSPPPTTPATTPPTTEVVTPAPRSRRIAAWTLFGGGLAIALTGGVLDILALTHSHQPPNEAFDSYEGYTDWYEGTRNMAISGDVLLAVGAAAALSGLIWLVVQRLRRSRQREPDREATHAPVTEPTLSSAGDSP